MQMYSTDVICLTLHTLKNRPTPLFIYCKQLAYPAVKYYLRCNKQF